MESIDFINNFMTTHGSEKILEKWFSTEVQEYIIKLSLFSQDLYTESVLLCQYKYHKDYIHNRIKSGQELGIKFRFPSIPEDISENIIKFMIHKNGDTSSRWRDRSTGDTGDLVSDIEGKQECKSFTSNGPLSFTPTSDWGVLYFLDAREWLDDRYVLYRIGLKRTSKEWQNIKVSKTQTIGDQCRQGRRPRICWNSLYSQIPDLCEKIYDGNFSDIFVGLNE